MATEDNGSIVRTEAGGQSIRGEPAADPHSHGRSRGGPGSWAPVASASRSRSGGSTAGSRPADWGAVRASEVDEAALGVGVHELYAHPIADVEPFAAALDPALHGRVEDAYPRALGSRTRDEPVELGADPVRAQARPD